MAIPSRASPIGSSAGSPTQWDNGWRMAQAAARTNLAAGAAPSSPPTVPPGSPETSIGSEALSPAAGVQLVMLDAPQDGLPSLPEIVLSSQAGFTPAPV